MKDFLRVDEVAKELGVSTKTIYRLIKDADNPLISKKIGGSIRIKRSDLENYINSSVVKDY